MRKVQRESQLDRAVDATVRRCFLFVRYLDTLAKKLGMTCHQAQILLFLRTNSPVDMSRIARAFGLTKPAITSLVDALIKKKLALRDRDTIDRRVISVRISKKGKAQCTLFRGEIHALLRKASHGLEEEEIKGFLKMAERLVSGQSQFGK